MDIRPYTNDSYKPAESVKTAVKSNHSQYRAGVIQQASTALMIPPAIRAKLSHISQVYNLPFDLGEFSLEDATPENIKAFRKVTEMLTNNSKLLPEILKCVKAVMKVDMKVAEFHKNVVKLSIKHQEKIDKETAEIFLAMARYGAKATKREIRTNTRNSLIEKRTQAYESYYQDSVFGQESRITDLEYQLAASDAKILSETKAKRLELNSERKKKAQAYVDSAFEN